jgi:hypothetical protein
MIKFVIASISVGFRTGYVGKPEFERPHHFGKMRATIILFSSEEFRRVQRYIENNPAAACLAAKPQHEWSSAGRPVRPPQAGGLPHRPLGLLKNVETPITG